MTGDANYHHQIRLCFLNHGCKKHSSKPADPRVNSYLIVQVHVK